MNILFISKLHGNLWAGPNNSVPAQVLAQSKLDNVMWVNLNHVCQPQWRRNEYQFINFDDIENCTLRDLPYPFNKPDYIIFEAVYYFLPFDRMVRSIIKSGIPYSIVPRSALTLKGQQHHWLKKKIANTLFYNKFFKKSNAIQYLTNWEKEESDKFFKHKSFIIPNGTYIPEEYKKEFNKDSFRIIYIGRLEIYQKGLDDLISAIATIQNVLRSEKISFELFGPDRNSSVDILVSNIKKNSIEDLVSIRPPVFGKDKEDLLKSADVFIMTSRFEGMPMGLIEALAYGLPCIVTEGTYMMDEIIEYDAGWGAGTSAESIKNAILKFIAEHKLLPKKSKNARTLATHYSWDHLATILHDKIKENIEAEYRQTN